MDYKEVFKCSIDLAKSNDTAGQLAFLNALGSRTTEGRRYRGNQKDETPPLPNDQLEQVLASYRKLKQAKPDWLTNQVVQYVLTELKRAKRPDENDLYRDSVSKPETISQVQEACCNWLPAEATSPPVATLFEKLEKLQGPPKPTMALNQMPTRQAAEFFVATIGERAKEKAFNDITRLLDTYLAHVRKQNVVLLKSPTAKSATAGRQVNYGMYGRMVLDFPQANDYFDAGSINLLRTSYDAFREADLLSDLFAHFQKQLAAASGGENVYHHLAPGLYALVERREGRVAPTAYSRRQTGAE